MSETDKLRYMDTEGMSDIVMRGTHAILDIRPIEAYNGWQLRDEPRGGHVPGAKSVPAKWFDYLDIMDILIAKGIDGEQPIIIYGYDKAELKKTADILGVMGFEGISVYDGFLSEWIPRGMPLRALDRYDKAVPASWLKRLIDEGSLPGVSDDFIVCHCHYRNPDDYLQGHIPGAHPLDTNSLESTVTWNRRTPDELESTFTGLGITHNTTVILYGRFSSPDNDDDFPGSSEGQLAAMRCAFIMLYAGVKDVRILNGGLQSWEDEGFATVRNAEEPRSVTDFGARIPGRPELAVDTSEAKEILAHPDKNLVCVRSWPELIGRVSGYNYIEKKGRIPGAVFGNCGSDAYHMENYRNLDHTGREYHEIEEMWREVGITSDKFNAFYCGTGWRGSEAFFNAWLMGWDDIAVYDGGWFEWSNDDANPIETGEPIGLRIPGRIYGL